MSDVFISYSRRDKAFVERLHNALKEQGRETWVDWQDIPLTADWWQEIERGIEGANTFAFVISPDSVASEVCDREINHAVEYNKRLVPIVHREGFKQTHEALARHNWLFFRESDDFDRGFEQLTQAIDTDLEHVRSHTRLLERAIEWDKANRNESFVLRGVDLETAEAWLLKGASRQPQPTALQGEYIHTSRIVETKRQRTEARRQRGFVVGVGTFAVLALGAAGFAFYQQQEALAQKKEAIAQRQEAQDQRHTAEAQKAEAEKQTNLADQEKQNAQKQKQTAEDALKQTEAAKQIAEQKTQEARTALSATELARQSEAQQREIAQQRQREAEMAQRSASEQKAVAVAAQRLAQDQKAEAENQTKVAIAQKAIAEQQTEEARKQRKEAELQSKVAFAYQLATQAQSTEKGNALNFSRWESTPAFKLWLGLDFLSSQEKSLLATAEITPTTINFSPDRKLLAGADDDHLYLFDLSSNERLVTINHPGILGINFSPDGKFLGSASDDGTYQVWTTKGQQILMLKAHYAEVTDATYSPDGRFLATASRDHTAKIWAGYGKSEILSLEHDDSVNTVQFSPSSRYLLTASNDCTARIWDSSNGQLIATVVHKTPIKLARFMNSDFFATVSGNSTVHFFPFQPTDPNWLKTYSINSEHHSCPRAK